ncbi:MAG: DUF5777 family beta-barrel protein [Chitinophagaceae bacterium]
MKLLKNNPRCRITMAVCLASCLFLVQGNLYAQDSTTVAEEPAVKAKAKPVKNTFESIWIIDNQTVMVPIKKTFEMDIMHRFGTVDKGYQDFWGFFAPSNIRLGFSYSPTNRLNLGIGITKSSMLWDASAKYSIITQTKGKYPVSVTYFGDAAIDTRKNPTLYDGSDVKHTSDQIYFFHQLIIARKITDKFSLQVAPSVSHQNAVPGFYTKNDSTGKEIFRSMKNNHFAIALSGRYKLSGVISLLFNYDQPLTKHPANNPNPNLSFGVAFTTSSHSFQLFLGNYSLLNQQRNNLFNNNSPFDKADDGTGKKIQGGKFLIGFNITRLWNY